MSEELNPLVSLKKVINRSLNEITIDGKSLQENGYNFIIAEDGQQTADYNDVVTIDEQATYNQPMYKYPKQRGLLSYRVATITMVSGSNGRVDWNQGRTKTIMNTLMYMIDDTSSTEYNIHHIALTSTPKSAGDDLNGNTRYQSRIKFIYKGEI